MSSSLIVEYLDEVEEGHLGLAATEEMLPKLVLDRGEPALDDGVVVAVAPSAHAPGHALRVVSKNIHELKPRAPGRFGLEVSRHGSPMEARIFVVRVGVLCQNSALLK